MLILEIAGGIILAVILLPFVPLILELLFQILKWIIILGIGAGVIYYLHLLNPIIIPILILLGLLGVFIYNFYLGYTSDDNILEQNPAEKEINHNSIENDTDYNSVWGVDK